MKKLLRFKRKTFTYPGGKKGVCYSCTCKKIPLFVWIDLVWSMFDGLTMCFFIDNVGQEHRRKIKEFFSKIDNADYDMLDEDTIYNQDQIVIILHKNDIKLVENAVSILESDKNSDETIKISGYYDIPNLDYSDYDVWTDIICNEIKDVIVFEKDQNEHISICFLETEFYEPQMIERVRMMCNDYGYTFRLNFRRVRTTVSNLLGRNIKTQIKNRR